MSTRVRAVEAIIDATIAAAELAMTDELRTLSDVDRSLLAGAVRDLRAFGDALSVIVRAGGATDLLVPVMSAMRTVGWFSGPLAQGEPLFDRGRTAPASFAKALRQATVDAAIANAVAVAGHRRPKHAVMTLAINERLAAAGREPLSERAIRRRMKELGLDERGAANDRGRRRRAAG